MVSLKNEKEYYQREIGLSTLFTPSKAYSMNKVLFFDIEYFIHNTFRNDPTTKIFYPIQFSLVNYYRERLIHEYLDYYSWGQDYYNSMKLWLKRRRINPLSSIPIDRLNAKLQVYINKSSLLFGYGVENDIKGLKAIGIDIQSFCQVYDISELSLFQNFKGKRSLRDIYNTNFPGDIQIQEIEGGHDAREDTEALRKIYIKYEKHINIELPRLMFHG